jgi:hypothetical protein
VQVAELERLRREEARRTAEIEAALTAVRLDGTVVEGREAALRAELEELRRQHAERKVCYSCTPIRRQCANIKAVYDQCSCLRTA